MYVDIFQNITETEAILTAKKKSCLIEDFDNNI